MSDQFATDHYTVEEIKKHVPKVEKVGNRLICDGIAVYEWQLTEDELREHFPERYEHERSIGPCPLCGKEMLADKRTWSMHIRIGHKEWYAANAEAVRQMTEYEELIRYVRDELATRPEGSAEHEDTAGNAGND